MNLSNKNLLIMLNRLIKLFTNLGVRVDSSLAIKIVLTFKRWSTCEGHHGLKRSKVINLGFIRALMGVEYSLPVSSKYKRMVKRALIQAGSSTLSAVFWTSVFSFHRLFRGPVVYDTQTLTQSFTGKPIKIMLFLPSLMKACNHLRTLGKHSQVWCANWKWHISGKSGPNGSMAFTRYLEDLRAIRRNGLYLKNLFLMYSLPLKNREEAHDFISRAYSEAHSRLKEKEDCSHSRLAFLSDKAGKTRVVAMVDILSQSNLAIVHNRLFSFLRNLETDGTFDQDHQRRRIRKWSEEKEFTSSIDLTAATDRLPVLYQALVLYKLHLLSFNQALAWLMVVSWRPFEITGVGGELKYTVGQPMGALSSWPAMAVSHHALVWWAYKEAYPSSKKRFSDYALLGDDLVIRNRRVSEAYLKIISALGVEVSLEKSFISDSRAEFAKSLFRYGKDLTPFPVAELNFTNKTVSNNTLSILSWLKFRKLKLTLSLLTGLFPAGKWRKMALLTTLSPVSPRNLLDVQPVDDFEIFYSLLWQKRVNYFSRRKTLLETVYSFWQKNPIIERSRLASPYAQLAEDNSISYPVQGIRSGNDQTYSILGSQFVAYCSNANPNGIAPLGPKLVPLPSWKEGMDDELFTSSLLSVERRLPGYFTKRCSGPAVGK
eukprot:89203_1